MWQGRWRSQLRQVGAFLGAAQNALLTFKSRHQRQIFSSVFYWDTDFGGDPRLRRKTAPKKHKATLKAFYHWIKGNRHKRLDHLMPMLKRKIEGFGNYFALPDNSLSVSRVYDHILHSLFKWLNRRSQRRSFNWQGLKDMLRYFQIESMRVKKRHLAVDWY